MRVDFNGRILVIGCGYVARCSLPLILKHIAIKPENITVIDFVDPPNCVVPLVEQGVNYVKMRITHDNLSATLSAYTGTGDMVIDLAWNIDACEIIQWCHDNDVRYINTSVEVWDPFENAAEKTPQERTLYHRHMNIRAMKNTWLKKGATAIIEHGANPGLVSHFTKKALIDIAKQIIDDGKDQARIEIFKDLLDKKDFPKLSQQLSVKVIHISERDLQISNDPKKKDEFVNTWSIEGLYEESIAPSELGWGTHELEMPENAYTFSSGPQNQICLAQAGMKTRVCSYVPCGEIIGFIIRHGEAFTLSNHLTVMENNKPVYRPTVHYVYCMSDAAIASMHELEMRNFNLQEKQRIMTDEIIDGADQLGVLLMGHPYQSWWCGSILDIHESREILPHQNATTMQVAAGVISAMIWAIKNPEEGLLVPDDLPYEEILSYAQPYLGTIVSQAYDWNPLKVRSLLFEKYNAFEQDIDQDPWQFKNFIIG